MAICRWTQKLHFSPGLSSLSNFLAKWRFWSTFRIDVFLFHPLRAVILNKICSSSLSFLCLGAYFLSKLDFPRSSLSNFPLKWIIIIIEKHITIACMLWLLSLNVALLNNSLIYSPYHSFTHSITNSLTHSLTYTQ